MKKNLDQKQPILPSEFGEKLLVDSMNAFSQNAFQIGGLILVRFA
jgi:hypothetical protein